MEELKNKILEICKIQEVELREKAINDLFDNEYKNRTIVYYIKDYFDYRLPCSEFILDPDKITHNIHTTFLGS